MIVLIILIVTTLFGGLASLLFVRSSFEYDEVQQNFFDGFHSIMAALSKLSHQVLGSRSRTMLPKIFLMLLLAFLGALLWYTIQITGIKSYLEFLWGGMTIEPGEDERNFLIKRAPWVYLDLSRNSGKDISVANQYLEALVLTLVIFIALSASLCASILNSVSLVRKLGRERLQVWHALIRILFTTCVGITIDLLFLIVFLLLVILVGLTFDTSIEETFNASISDKALEYGYTLSVGGHNIGETLIGMGIWIPDIDFDSLGANQVSESIWVHWIFPEPAFVNDAGTLCHRYGFGGLQCADHLRALYLGNFSQLGYSTATLVRQIAQHLATIGASLACGHNLWSSIPGGKMQHQLVAVMLPLAAALAVVVLSRLLLMPWLVLILLLDDAIIRFGRHAALSSETGLSLVSRHGPKLLAAPPVIATGILVLLAKAMC